MPAPDRLALADLAGDAANRDSPTRIADITLTEH
jgi:hypothetical protein